MNFIIVTDWLEGLLFLLYFYCASIGTGLGIIIGGYKREYITKKQMHNKLLHLLIFNFKIIVVVYVISIILAYISYIEYFDKYSHNIEVISYIVVISTLIFYPYYKYVNILINDIDFKIDYKTDSILHLIFGQIGLIFISYIILIINVLGTATTDVDLTYVILFTNTCIGYASNKFFLNKLVKEYKLPTYRG